MDDDKYKIECMVSYNSLESTLNMYKDEYEAISISAGQDQYCALLVKKD